MTRKALVVVGAVALSIALVVMAFAGGVVVGRFSMRWDATPPVVAGVTATPMPETPKPPTLTPVEEEGGEAEEGEADTPEPETTPTPLDTAPVEAFDYDLLRKVLNILEKQYYGEIPDGKTLAYGAIRGMLLTLDDPYTSFIEPEISAIMNEDASGEFEGIGAMVTMRDDGYLEIASLIPGQPAEKAGVKPGDLILSVNGQSIVGLGLYEAISYIRGPAGTEAELEIARPGEPEPIYITVTRARIEIPVVEYEMLENDIAYISLTEFDAKATERVHAALDELLDQDPQGLVFDLRGNPGGWLDQAIKMSDLFLGEGLVAIERDSAGGEQRFYAFDGDIGEDIPMVVLVNGGSASAAEIVAGALRDRDRATLIGTTTLGKGSVQRPNELSDGSQLRVTIARWFTPDDVSIHGDGLAPDIEVEFPEDVAEGEDPQLERAVEYLTDGE
jgi:carboxyl-terminal processing protease